MTALEWPDPPPPDRNALRADLNSLVDQIVNAELTALDTLDDQFARMAAALITLLDHHEPDSTGRCPRCTPAAPGCETLETIHNYLNQPLTLVWWHELRRRGEPMPIDQIGTWLANSSTPRPWDRRTTPAVRWSQ